MKKNFINKKGFTLPELMFAISIYTLVLGVILSVFLFLNNRWLINIKESTLTRDIQKAVNTIKEDLRFSSVNYMSFYPSSGPPYSAISIPVVETDNNGFLTFNSSGDILWNKTVIYHVFNNNGKKTLRRTVFSPRNNNLTKNQLYNQLSSVVSLSGASSAITNNGFLENLESFNINWVSSERKSLKFSIDTCINYKDRELKKNNIFTIKPWNNDSSSMVFGLGKVVNSGASGGNNSGGSDSSGTTDDGCFGSF